MFGFRKLSTLDLVCSKVRQRKKETISFFITIITFVTVWKHGGSSIMFETKFDTSHSSFIGSRSNLLNYGSIVLKNKAMLDNHSYSDGSSSLFYHEELLQAAKRPLLEYSTNKTKSILVWTQTWNKLPK